MQEISGENAGQLGQQHLRFVRRGVCCCSAVARGPLLLPSPSLGVSSLDLGRCRKVSGPFSLQECRTWQRSRKTNNACRCAFLRSNFFSSAARLPTTLLLFLTARFYLSARASVRAEGGADLIRPRRPDRGAIPRAGFPRADRRGSRTQARACRTKPPAGSGVRPCTALG